MTDHPTRPGSVAEHALQERHGTFKRAAAFYDKQMLDHLNPLMIEYLARQEMAFIATADQHGEADCSFRAGPPGFVRVLDSKTVMYPEYRGNGVMASLGNMTENGHVGLLFVDFAEHQVGLHVNGKARIVEDDAVKALAPLLARLSGGAPLHEPEASAKTTPERWIVVEIEEAYIHCSKHIPTMRKLDKDIDWGTDDTVRKGGDYFKAKHSERPWVQVEEAAPEPVPEPEPQPQPAAEQAPEPVVAESPFVVSVHEPPAPAPTLEAKLEQLEPESEPVFEVPFPAVAAGSSTRPFFRLRRS
jgi:uncharacterized protein